MGDACPNGVISEVFIDNHSVFDQTDPTLDARFDWAYGLVNRLHVRTREEVIRREILVSAGDCYDVERLRDSERLLRAMPFIASVDVFGVQQADSTFHVIVDTRDEWSTRVEPRFSSGGGAMPRGIRLREDNLLGTGRHLSLFYLDRDEEKSYGFAIGTLQFLNSRWNADLEAGRTSVGYLLSQSINYPFVGQTGRWAMTEAVHHQDRYFELWIPRGGELLPLWYPERRRSLDLGAAYRWGTRGQNSTLLGATLLGQWVSYPGQPRFGRGVPAGEVPLLIPELPMDSISSIRAMVLAGKRSVYHVRRRAFDTVNGIEDVQLGVETAIGLGPSIPALSRDRDMAANLSLFAGGEVAGSLTGMQLTVQGRRNYDAPAGRSEWSDVFGEVNAWSYWRPDLESRNTIVASVRAAGGWHTVTPFQLTLGSDAGLRGFARHTDPGGRRIVASLENRAFLGWPLPDLFDLGGVAFLDAGKIWPGSAPFGVTSPTRVNAGAGLRAAFPPGSRQTLRIDLGVPIVAREDQRRFFLSVGMGQMIGSRAAIYQQLQRSVRVGSVPTFIRPAEP